MIYEYECRTCKRNFTEIRSYEKRNEAFCCGRQAIKLICSNPFIVNETRDYTFTSKNFGKTPVHVNGRHHYKKLLKQYGYADATIKECLSVKPSKQESYKVTSKRKEIATKIKSRLNQEGLTGHLQGAIKAVTKQK